MHAFWQYFVMQYANLIIDSGDELKLVDECRNLGVYLVSARRFKCSCNNAKCAFYRAFNAIFGRLGRSASSEVVVWLERMSNRCYGFPVAAASYQ